MTRIIKNKNGSFSGSSLDGSWELYVKIEKRKKKIENILSKNK